MLEKTTRNALIVHDDSQISRVAELLERCKYDIALFRRILSKDKGLPDEYYRVNLDQVRSRLESTQWALDDLLEDIEEGLLVKELQEIRKEYVENRLNQESEGTLYGCVCEEN